MKRTLAPLTCAATLVAATASVPRSTASQTHFSLSASVGAGPLFAGVSVGIGTRYDPVSVFAPHGGGGYREHGVWDGQWQGGYWDASFVRLRGPWSPGWNPCWPSYGWWRAPHSLLAYPYSPYVHPSCRDLLASCCWTAGFQLVWAGGFRTWTTWPVRYWTGPFHRSWGLFAYDPQDWYWDSYRDGYRDGRRWNRLGWMHAASGGGGRGSRGSARDGVGYKADPRAGSSKAVPRDGGRSLPSRHDLRPETPRKAQPRPTAVGARRAMERATESRERGSSENATERSRLGRGASAVDTGHPPSRRHAPPIRRAIGSDGRKGVLPARESIAKSTSNRRGIANPGNIPVATKAPVPNRAVREAPPSPRATTSPPTRGRTATTRAPRPTVERRTTPDRKPAAGRAASEMRDARSPVGGFPSSVRPNRAVRSSPQWSRIPSGAARTVAKPQRSKPAASRPSQAKPTRPKVSTRPAKTRTSAGSSRAAKRGGRGR